LTTTIATYGGGINMNEATKKYQIPYTSFRKHLYGKCISRQCGAKEILSCKEEDQLAMWLVQMVEWGHGVSPIDLRLKVSEITMNCAHHFTIEFLGKGRCGVGSIDTLNSIYEQHKYYSQ